MQRWLILFPLPSGLMPWLSDRVCIVLPLLSFATIWGQTRLCLSKENIPRPLYPWRFVPILANNSKKNFHDTDGKCINISFFHLLIGFQFDYVFDWTILKYQQSQIAAPPTRGLVSSIYVFLPWNWLSELQMKTCIFYLLGYGCWTKLWNTTCYSEWWQADR